MLVLASISQKLYGLWLYNPSKDIFNQKFVKFRPQLSLLLLIISILDKKCQKAAMKICLNAGLCTKLMSQTNIFHGSKLICEWESYKMYENHGNIFIFV